MDAVDRISDLDVDITDLILQCLPLKDAVRTSILSTSWRYKRLLLPQLILDHAFFRSIPLLNEYYLPNLNASTLDVGMLQLSNIVNILLSHVRLIHKFVLEIPKWFTKYAYISRWLRSVSRKLVKEITLSTHSYGRKKLKLPSWFFFCVEFDHLTHLAINYFYIPANSASFRGFPSLISLKLRLSESSWGEVGMIVSKCPVLENLDLEVDAAAERCLTIHAPKLQNFVVHGRLSRFILEETVRIKKLSFSAPQDWNVMNYFGEAGEFLNDLQTKIKEVKHLIVNGVYLNSQRLFSDFFHLLNMAPNMQILEITVAGQPDRSCITGVEDCWLGHLKSAQITVRFLNSESKMVLQLVKGILSFSPLLEIMTIKAYIVDAQMLKIVKELLQGHRVSANTKIFLCIPRRGLVDEVIRVV